MIDIFVDPTDWGGGFIVVSNVAYQLARKILFTEVKNGYKKNEDRNEESRNRSGCCLKLAPRFVVSSKQIEKDGYDKIC
jgi:hypothetical protein